MLPFAVEFNARVGVGVGVVVVVVAVAVVAFAVKEVVSDPLVAVKVCVPAVEPSTQLPTAAIPFEPVVADDPDIKPLPVGTAKLTVAPLTGLLFTSLTITLGGISTAVLTGADWLFPAFTAICVAAPATGVIAVLVPVDESSSVPVIVYAVPATMPVVNVTVAIPAALVILVNAKKEPPVPVFDQVTTSPAVAFAVLLSKLSWAVMITSAPATGA